MKTQYFHHQYRFLMDRRLLCCLLLFTSCFLGGYAQAAESKAPDTPDISREAGVGVLQVTGPNQIEKTVVQVRDRSLSQSREQVLSVEWWPMSCRECVSNARITEQTLVQNADGSSEPLWSMTVGVTYYATALIFATDSVDDLSVLVLSN